MPILVVSDLNEEFHIDVFIPMDEEGPLQINLDEFPVGQLMGEEELPQYVQNGEQDPMQADQVMQIGFVEIQDAPFDPRFNSTA